MLRNEETLRDSVPIDMLLSAVSVLVVAQSSSEVPEGLMNNPVYIAVCTFYRQSNEPRALAVSSLIELL